MADSTSDKPDESAAPADTAAVEAGLLSTAPQAIASPVDLIEAELNRLPTYARRLLRIRVPVRLTLASQRKHIQEIIELGPGSIIKFDKTCDEPLDLCVGDRPIAQGEVVKVGDKFGVKI